MGGQKSAFFEISIEIKSAQPVSCSDEAELVGRPGASDADAQLQQALGGLRPGLARLNSPVSWLSCSAPARLPPGVGSEGWVGGL